ncbi:tyrosine-type recombinase/integrase [Amycolatopsis sp. NPDC005003]
MDGKLVYSESGRPVREKTELFGKGERYKVHYYDADGNERSKSFPDKELTRAKTFLTKMQHDVLSGEFVDPKAGELLFRQYVKQWRKGQSADASTRQTLDGRFDASILPFLGDKPLRVVEKTDTIRDWLSWLERPKSEDGRGLAASYRAVLFDIVSGVLESAFFDKKIRRNPCKAKSIKRPKSDQRKVVSWKEAQVHQIKLALPEPYKVVVPLGAGVGLRQMEIFGFSPDDLDRDAMIANVQRQIRWIGTTPVFAPPKGGKTRVVPVGAGVLDEIDDYMERFEPVTVTLPWLEPGGRPETVRLLIRKVRRPNQVRGRAASEVISGINFNRDVWVPAYKTAGLDYTPKRDGMHGMRHFYASTALAAGVSIKELAEYLGHHDPGYTLRIYTHLVPSSHRRARAATDKIFKPRRSRTAPESETA